VVDLVTKKSREIFQIISGTTVTTKLRWPKESKEEKVKGVGKKKIIGFSSVLMYVAKCKSKENFNGGKGHIYIK
jgi:hypothetical protein